MPLAGAAQHTSPLPPAPAQQSPGIALPPDVLARHPRYGTQPQAAMPSAPQAAPPEAAAPAALPPDVLARHPRYGTQPQANHRQPETPAQVAQPANPGTLPPDVLARHPRYGTQPQPSPER
jgi:hypothetical protein